MWLFKAVTPLIMFRTHALLSQSNINGSLKASCLVDVTELIKLDAAHWTEVIPGV